MSLAAPLSLAANNGGGAVAALRRRHPTPFPRALPRATLAPIASVPQAAAVGAIFLTMEATMHFPADAVVRRYRDNPKAEPSPEDWARLAEALHEHAMHINDEVELSFANQRSPLPSPEDIVRRSGW